MFDGPELETLAETLTDIEADEFTRPQLVVALREPWP
jgi:hypothetical protein